MAETSQDRLVVAKQIVDLFRWERFTYLAVSLVAAVIVIFVGVEALVKGNYSKSDLTLLAGSGGIIGVSVSRLLAMFNKVLKEVFQSDVTSGGGRNAGSV